MRRSQVDTAYGKPDSDGAWVRATAVCAAQLSNTATTCLQL